MSQYSVTKKRSLWSSVVYYFLKFSGLKHKLASDSFDKLHSYEDFKTPIKKRYIKEVFDDTACYWINREKKENGVFVYLAGGGFITGPSKLHWLYCEKMSKELDMAVLLIRYGLAPEQPFPIGLDGTVNAIITLQKRGVLQQNWFMAGDSAGGNLALTSCYKLHELKAALPQKLVLLYPSVDMDSQISAAEDQETIRKDIVLDLKFTKRVLEAYAGNHDIHNALLSPVNGRIEVLPPVLLQHGTNDVLIRGSRKFVKKMEAASKSIQYEEYEGMFHGFIIMTGLPEAKIAIRSQINFIKS